MPAHGHDGDVLSDVRTELMLLLGAARRLLNSTPLTTAQLADLRTVQRSGNQLLDHFNHLVADVEPAPRPVIPDQQTNTD
jgi:hypothetical protein